MPFTQTDADELKMPLKLLQQWDTVMNAIWKWGIAAKVPGWKSGENEIHCSYCIVRANFYNSSWIEVSLRPFDEAKSAWLTVYYRGNVKAVITAIAAILTDLANNP